MLLHLCSVQWYRFEEVLERLTEVLGWMGAQSRNQTELGHPASARAFRYACCTLKFFKKRGGSLKVIKL